MSIIITRPEHDLTTRYLSHWSEQIIKLARKKGFKVVDLKKEKANRKEVIGRIKKLDPSLVILNGHGNDHSIAGHDNKIIFNAGENEDVLNSRITYAISCSSANVLGAESVKMGNSTYIGYKDEFIFTASQKCRTRPLEDNRAKPFMESSNQVATTLLKGHNCKDASDRSKDKFKENYKKLLSSESDPDSIQDAQLLWWDMTHQVCLGKQDAVI